MSNLDSFKSKIDDQIRSYYFEQYHSYLKQTWYKPWLSAYLNGEIEININTYLEEMLETFILYFKQFIYEHIPEIAPSRKALLKMNKFKSKPHERQACQVFGAVWTYNQAKQQHYKGYIIHQGILMDIKMLEHAKQQSYSIPVNVTFDWYQNSTKINYETLFSIKHVISAIARYLYENSCQPSFNKQRIFCLLNDIKDRRKKYALKRSELICEAIKAVSRMPIAKIESTSKLNPVKSTPYYSERKFKAHMISELCRLVCLDGKQDSPPHKLLRNVRKKSINALSLGQLQSLVYQSLYDYASQSRSQTYRYVISGRQHRLLSTYAQRHNGSYPLICVLSQLDYLASLFAVLGTDYDCGQYFHSLLIKLKGIGISNKKLKPLFESFIPKRTSHFNIVSKGVHDRLVYLRYFLALIKLLEGSTHIKKMLAFVCTQMVSEERGSNEIPTTLGDLVRLVQYLQNNRVNLDAIFALPLPTSMRSLLANLEKTQYTETIELLNQAIDSSKHILKSTHIIDLSIGMRILFPYHQFVRSFNHPLQPSIITEPIIKTVKQLSIGLFPPTYLEGYIGCAVPGICIDFGGFNHRQHYRNECANLIVFDQHQVYLWSLVIDMRVHSMTLQKVVQAIVINNLQGALPSRYRQYLPNLIAHYVDILLKAAQSKPVLYRNLTFNSYSIDNQYCQDIDVIQIEAPLDIRLDVYDGEINVLGKPS